MRERERKSKRDKARDTERERQNERDRARERGRETETEREKARVRKKGQTERENDINQAKRVGI